jgi:carboxyl-terminal processing protease
MDACLRMKKKPLFIRKFIFQFDTMRPVHVLIIVVAAATFAACKKKNKERSYDEIVMDTVVSYTKEIYLWNTQLPATLPGKTPTEVMTNIRQYSIEPGFSGPVDRWSFAISKDEWNKLSTGVSADFGMRVFFRTSTDLRVAGVDKNGPAGIAGVQRGWKINSINGVAINDTSQSNFIVTTVYASPTTRFTFQLPDNSTRDVTLNSQIFTGNPFYLDSVYTQGANKIGYLVLNSFLGDTTQMKTRFDNAFTKFGGAGITDLVIDLRYNGGGYVLLAEYLLNYIVPNSGNNQMMFTEAYNDKYASRFNETVTFKKKGSVNLNRIFFIVSKQSASASELTINSIRPFVDVKIVGPTNSHGKPVGYGGYSAGSWYFFPVSFKTINKNNEANYYNGFAPDYVSADGLDKNWGDVNEACLFRTIRFITTGSWSRLAPIDETLAREQARLAPVNLQIDAPKFKGMISKKGIKRIY